MKTELVALRRRTSRMVKTIILAFAVLTMATGCGTLETAWQQVIVQPILEYESDPCQIPTKWDSEKRDWVVDAGRIGSWNIGKCVEKWRD